jgi:gliding motility-associated protein GldC
MMTSSIRIDISLDTDRIPETISWSATESSSDELKKAKALMLAFWDAADKSALRIDLWTKDMMVDEMGDFYYQTLMTMADTFHRATRDERLVEELRQFAKSFYQKFRESQLRQNKL